MIGRRIDALVLAAGESSRLGQPKQLVRLHGQSLLERAVTRVAPAINGHVHVVLGANAQAHLEVIETAVVRPHICADWARGQQASLRFGLARIEPNTAVLVVVVDQYRVAADDFTALVNAWRAAPERPAAARYADAMGVPVVWPSTYVQRLKKVARGRDLLTEDRCSAVNIDAAAYDLDTPDHLIQLREFERNTVG